MGRRTVFFSSTYILFLRLIQDTKVSFEIKQVQKVGHRCMFEKWKIGSFNMSINTTKYFLPLFAVFSLFLVFYSRFNESSLIESNIRNFFFNYSESSLIESNIRNFMKKLENLEKEKIQSIKKLDTTNISNKDAKLFFFQTLAFPMQSICKVLKRIGGSWNKRQVDGDKFICMDRLFSKNKCIIYSFGISNDWTFEDLLDSSGLGCQIFAYDHTINNVPSRRGEQIFYFKTGMGFGENLKSLSTLIAENKHKNDTIDYLKIDIEGTELSDGGFKDWIESGALQNVDQIALEMHVIQKGSNERQYIELLHILRDMYQLGFVLISQEVNMVWGPRDPDGLYDLIEIVFMKA